MRIYYSNYFHSLNSTFSKYPNCTTEDLVRWLFITNHPNIPEIETPYIRTKLPMTPIKIHPAKSKYLASTRIRADLVYPKNDAVIEFKCHRATKYSPCCTATDMGSVFNDLNRLSILDNKEKYLIYVFDSTMKKYYDGVMKNFPTTNPLRIFEISPTAIGKKYAIDSSFDASLAPTNNYSEFKKKAFYSFNHVAHKFSCFNYQIEIKESQQIGNTPYYVIVAQVF